MKLALLAILALLLAGCATQSDRTMKDMESMVEKLDAKGCDLKSVKVVAKRGSIAVECYDHYE